MQEIPIYLFTGFMDSGKTTLIKETLLENGFADQGKSLIICCEDGEVEYDEAELKKINASLVMVENEEDFTADFLNAINMKYLPDQVFIEYNGTWGMDTLTETELPRGWMVVQSLATVDATTFDMYLANMRTMIMEQLFQADVVIFNRCDDSTDKGKYRRNVKALNRKAQLVYERTDGSLDEREEELPFDISGDELEINGVRIQAVPAYNIGKQFHPQQNQWVGYLVTMNDVIYYIAGDTDINEDVKKVRCDVALLPVGGTYTMTAEEAAKLTEIIHPKAAIPTHYGSVAGKAEDGQIFADLLKDKINVIIKM